MASNNCWESRIGASAAAQIRRGQTLRRVGVILVLLFVALEISFQLANYYRPGVEGSVVLLVAGIGCTIFGIRYYVAAGRIVAAQLGMRPELAKFVPLQRGPEAYDRWLAARSDSRWPVRGWR